MDLDEWMAANNQRTPEHTEPSSAVATDTGEREALLVVLPVSVSKRWFSSPFVPFFSVKEMLIGSSLPAQHGLPRSGRGDGGLDEVPQLHPRTVGLNHYCVLSIARDQACARKHREVVLPWAFLFVGIHSARMTESSARCSKLTEKYQKMIYLYS